MANYWQHFEHGADIGVRGIAASKAEAFAQAALALCAVITDLERITPAKSITLSCDAPDDELLLAEWLNSLIFEIATRNMIFSRFEVRIDDHRLSATVWGEPLQIDKHHPAVEVKGATYTSLQVRQQADGKWLAQCVVDV
ncbi:archease [Sulfuriflexus mobilis]|uniref:archease n=1 Tax=Sulfuriflexus mobilis TaxID=1811807 RepID=UPI000F83B2B7|nr:archease [Sulfuriflexus mobilis]